MAKNDATELDVEAGLFHGDNKPHVLKDLPPPPPWRRFKNTQEPSESWIERGNGFKVRPKVVQMVNAALLLRRPLLVTGKPGTGKSSLAYAVAYELQLGEPLVWPITTRSTLQQGLYTYDAIARLQEASLQRPPVGGAAATAPDIGKYLRLGPLGTALATSTRTPPKPRVLLIDEIDKSDVDLPSDLLHVFEEAKFEIPELRRLPPGREFDVVEVLTYEGAESVKVPRGQVCAKEFPLVILTSNGEREFPPAFLRRCLPVEITPPTAEELAGIVKARLAPLPADNEKIEALIEDFLKRRDGESDDGGDLATDQLLNAVHLVMQRVPSLDRDDLREAIFKSLSGGG